MLQSRAVQLIGATTLLVLLGCSDAGTTEEPFAVRDSAGIRIAESASPRFGTLQVDSTPLVVIGDDFGAPDRYLYEVHHIEQFRDGQFVVGNSGTRELFYFEPDGTFLAQRGGAGDGPGELQRLYGMASCDADQIAVQEASRLSVFDANGDLVRTVQVAGFLAERSASLVGLSSDCEAALLVVRSGAQPESSDVVSSLTFPMYWASFADAHRDSVGPIPALDVQHREVDGRSAASRRPFGREAVWDVAHGQAVLGLGYDFEIQHMDRAGGVAQITRWKAQPDPVTEADWAHFSAQQAEAARLYPEEAPRMVPLDAYVVPSHKPPYSKLIADAEGRIWLQKYGSFGYFAPEPTSDWWVLSPKGRWLAEIRMPEGLEVLSIGNGRVIGVLRDSLDAESVRVHALPPELSR